MLCWHGEHVRKSNDGKQEYIDIDIDIIESYQFFKNLAKALAPIHTRGYTIALNVLQRQDCESERDLDVFRTWAQATGDQTGGLSQLVAITISSTFIQGHERKKTELGHILMTPKGEITCVASRGHRFDNDQTTMPANSLEKAAEKFLNFPAAS